MVSTTRPMSCRTLDSRRGPPSGPRKYLDTTTLVAVCDQARGTSTSRCSNTTRPSSPAITAERNSHSTSPNGSTPGWLKKRSSVSPARDAIWARSGAFGDFLSSPAIDISPAAMSPPPLTILNPQQMGHLYLFLANLTLSIVVSRITNINRWCKGLILLTLLKWLEL